MPPLPPIAQVIRFALSGIEGPTTWTNIFHVAYGGAAPSPSALNGLCTSMIGLWHTNLGPVVSDNDELTQVVAIDLSSSLASSGSATATSFGTFPHVSPTTAQVAALIHWKIQRRYRGGHPRTYVPGQDNANSINARQWSAAWSGALGTAGTAFMNAVNALAGASAPFSLGTVSYFDGNAMRALPIFEPYLAATGSQAVVTQRRRLGA